MTASWDYLGTHHASSYITHSMGYDTSNAITTHTIDEVRIEVTQTSGEKRRIGNEGLILS